MQALTRDHPSQGPVQAGVPPARALPPRRLSSLPAGSYCTLGRLAQPKQANMAVGRALTDACSAQATSRRRATHKLANIPERYVLARRAARGAVKVSVRVGEGEVRRRMAGRTRRAGGRRGQRTRLATSC